MLKGVFIQLYSHIKHWGSNLQCFRHRRLKYKYQPVPDLFSAWSKVTASSSTETEARGGGTGTLFTPILRGSSWLNPPGSGKPRCPDGALLPCLRRGQWTKPAACRWICVAVAWQLTAGKNLNPALAAHFRRYETMPGVFISGNNGKQLLCKKSRWRIYLKHASVQREP